MIEGRQPKRDNCRYCGKTWVELKILTTTNRQVCHASDCQDKMYEDNQARKTKNVSVDEWHSHRTQGEFYIAATEKGQCKALEESFFCWLCHKEHKPHELTKTLGITCQCSAQFVFTIGTRAEKSSIVRVDRLR